MMTPLEKFKSLPDAAQYLKPGVSFKDLDAIATKQSEVDPIGGTVCPVI